MSQGTLNIRKTLVLGLGTTGKEVAEQIAESLKWQYGDFERVSWVKLLVVETEKPSSPLGDRVIHFSISPEEYHEYLSNPMTKGAEFDFASWQNSDVLGSVSNATAGAGNRRMLGRLFLFHQGNYGALEARFKRELSALENLMPKDVTEALKQENLVVNFEDQIAVYVVGTLCGGTCSGVAPDLGYLMRQWSGNSVNPQAIFTLPHPSSSGSNSKRYKKNAFYALKELNHYLLTETSWLQKLPDHEQAHQQGAHILPYEILRVMNPPGPGSDDVPKLNAMIAQYLSAAAGSAGSKIAALDVNALNAMAGVEGMGFLRPMFSTMGISTLEFPGDHIMRGCTDRLIASTLARWLKVEGSDAMVKGALEKAGADDFKTVVQNLLQNNGERLSLVYSRKLETTGAGTPPKVTEVRELLRDVEGRLTVTAIPENGTGAQVLPVLVEVMQQNYERFRKATLDQVKSLIGGTLFSLEGGPGFLLKFLNEYQRRLEEWMGRVQHDLKELQADSRTLREQMEEQLAELERAQNSHNPMGKREKVRQGWEKFCTGYETYLETEVQMRALSFLQQRELLQTVRKEFQEVTIRLQRRLETLQSAFQQEQTVREKAWQERARMTPTVNGICYYTPAKSDKDGTMTERYYAGLQQKKYPEEPTIGWNIAEKESAAQRRVLHSLEELMDLLTREGESDFDPRPNRQSDRESLPTSTLTELERAARTYFEPLREQVHIAQLAQPNDIASAIQLSQPNLKIATTMLGEALRGTKTTSHTDVSMALMQTEGGAADKGKIETIKTQLLNANALNRGEISDNGDPFRLILIRETHGFTLGQMSGVIATNPHDLTALQSAEDCPDFKYWYTRTDVNWINPLTAQRERETAEEAWLLTVLLGHPKDTSPGKLTPARLDEIEARGWYTVLGDQFRVYYPEGVTETTRTEEMLPVDFALAVSRLLEPEYETLLKSLKSAYLGGYLREHGEKRFIEATEDVLESIASFGLKGKITADPKAAQQVVKRYYRRRAKLTSAYFDFKTKEMKNDHLFNDLHYLEDEIHPFAKTKINVDGYYCEAGHLLGSAPADLKEKEFTCPMCNNGERFWP